MPRYFILYKPYGLLSQFTRETPTQRTLADLDFAFPKNAYPLGRLDADSEGLLLLTDDKALNAKLLDPKNAHPRTYWVQVEGLPTEEALEKLRLGVDIRIDGKIHRTRPAEVIALSEGTDQRFLSLPERVPPIRIRLTIPDAWLQITLTEGKNRQVRRMCAAVGLPVLRLVRVGMGKLALGQMQPGEVLEIKQAELFEQLFAGSALEKKTP